MEMLLIPKVFLFDTNFHYFAGGEGFCSKGGAKCFFEKVIYIFLILFSQHTDSRLKRKKEGKSFLHQMLRIFSEY